MTTAATPTSTTTVEPNLFIEGNIGYPVTGDVEFVPESAIESLGSINYQPHWQGSGTVGVGIKIIKSETVEVKPAEETKVDKEPAAEKPAADATAATEKDEAKTEAKEAPAAPVETKVVQSGWGVAAVLTSSATGYTAPDIMEDTYTTFADASMALTALSGGIDVQRYFSNGLAVGIRPKLGIEKTCDSSGEILSVDCNSGYVITNPVTRFYMDDKHYEEVPRLVGGVTLTGAYDIWSPGGVQDGGVSFLVQASADLFSTPLYPRQVESNGGTHTYIDDSDASRRLSSTLDMKVMPVGVMFGVRVEGDLLRAFKPRGRFLGRQLGETKPAAEVETKPVYE